MSTTIVTPPTPAADESGSPPTRPRLSPSASVSFAEDLPRPRSSTVAASKEASPSPSKLGIRRSSSFNRARSASVPSKGAHDGPLLNVPHADASTSSLASTLNSTASSVSTKRQAEFEKHFGDELISHIGVNVPEDYLEVIQTQSADLQVSVLLHGRLYLTRYHLCFRSNILGIVTMKVHPLKDVVGVEKGTTAKWIQNAVYVWVDEEHNNHHHHHHHHHSKDHGGSPSGKHAEKEKKSGGASGTTTPKDGASTPSGPGGKYYGYGSMADRDMMYADLTEQWTARAPEKARAYFDSKGMGAGGASDDGGSPEGSDELAHEGDEGDRESVVTATPEGKTKSKGKAKVKVTKCSGEHYKEVALDTKIAVGMKDLFELLYENEEFHMDFLKNSQKLTDIKVNDWQDDGPGKKERTITYVLHMSNPIGPSKSDATGVEAIVKHDLENAIEVLGETQTPDVPSGKNFKVHTRTCLTHASLDDKPATRMYCTTQCDWSSSSLLKSTITPAVIKGQKEYHKQLIGAVQEWIKAHPDDFAHGDGDAEEEIKVVDVNEEEEVTEAQAPEGEKTDDADPKDVEKHHRSHGKHHGHHHGSERMGYGDMTLVDYAVQIWENPIMRWITVLCGMSMALNWWYIFR